jgi:hypothetical protein
MFAHKLVLHLSSQRALAPMAKPLSFHMSIIAPIGPQGLPAFCICYMPKSWWYLLGIRVCRKVKNVNCF